MSRTLVFWLAVLLVFAGAITSWIGLKRLRARSQAGAVAVRDDDPVSKTGEELTEFEFTDQFGKPFGSRDLEGKVWIGSFFFADCPALCVVQNNEIAKLHRRFADQGLNVVSITVTPKTDPPHKLRAYGRRFTTDREHWKFLTGRDIDYVRQVGIDIFALVAADETHTAHVAVFDRSGRRRGAYKVTARDEYVKLVKLIEEVLAQKPVSGVPTTDSTSSAETNETPEDVTAEDTSESQ